MAEAMQAPRAAADVRHGEVRAPQRASRSTLAHQLDASPPVQRLEAIRAMLSPPVQRVAATAPVIQRVISVGGEDWDLERLIASFRNQSDVVRALAGGDPVAALTAAYNELDGRSFDARKGLQKKVVDAVKHFAKTQGGGNAPARIQVGQYIGAGRQYVPDAVLAAIGIGGADPLHAKIGLLAAAQQVQTCTRFGDLLARVAQLVHAGAIGKTGVSEMIGALLPPWSQNQLQAAVAETATLDPRAAIGGPLVGVNVAVKGMIGELDGLVAASGHALAPDETVFSGSTYTSEADGTTEDVDISYIDAGGTLWLVEAAYDGNVLRNKTRGTQEQKTRYKKLAAAEALIHTPREGLTQAQSGDKNVRAIAFAYTIPRAAFEEMEATWTGQAILDLVGYMGSKIGLLVDGIESKVALRAVGERKAREEAASATGLEGKQESL